jgi:arylsulfatase A-like enzyme
MPQAMPGSTQSPFASEAFLGQSANGTYGDSVEELDWSAGEILDALERLELDENTLVIWTSDNGAPRRNPPQGSNAPLKGWGYDTSEGAMRMPCIIRWPGHVPAGVTCDLLCSAMDFYVTFAALGGGDVPGERIIDGHNIQPLLFGHPEAASPYEAFYYYDRGDLRAVRSGPWKLYFAADADGEDELYHLIDDIAEEHDVIADNPDVVDRLRGLADEARLDLGDGEQDGTGQRPAGWVEHPTGRVR